MKEKHFSVLKYKWNLFGNAESTSAAGSGKPDFDQNCSKNVVSVKIVEINSLFCYFCKKSFSFPVVIRQHACISCKQLIEYRKNQYVKIHFTKFKDLPKDGARCFYSYGS